MALVLGDDEKGAPRWRLLVLEDCDELVRAGAKSGSGQALWRLLNLTDGLIGQGLHTLVAITTNDPLSSLHLAVTRAGRCLAEVKVGLLSPGECRGCLGRAMHVPAKGMALAELVAHAKELTLVRNERRHLAVGNYL